MHSIVVPEALGWASEQVIFQIGEAAQLWRVVEGLVRLDHDDGRDRQPVQIAVPGDLIGTEALCQLPYQFNATALTSCRLEVVHVADTEAQTALLRQALMQQQSRSQDMSALRTGTVVQRLAHFLHLLGIERGTLAQTADAHLIRATLPSLREMAEVVDAKRETVCRALSMVLPSRRYKPRSLRQPDMASAGHFVY